MYIRRIVCHSTIFLFFILISSDISGQAVHKTRISGFVFDELTNEQLSGVSIVNENQLLAVSDSKGYFEFKLSQGNYRIRAQILGYKILTKELEVKNNEETNEIFFRLKPSPIEMSIITVTGDRFLDTLDAKTYELMPGEIRNIPQFGEKDALRVLQALPGISAVSDFSTQMYVRGGNFDETLISLDGVPLYNPYHLGGIFGSINTDLLEVERLYPSNYPVKFGGYLSGVLELLTKEGAKNKYQGTASLGLISSKFEFDGPLWNGSFVIAARRTYADLISSLINIDVPYYFYDIYTKYTLPIDSKNLISLKFFFSKDKYDMFQESNYNLIKEEQDPIWGNRIFDFSYTHLFSNQNSIDLKLYNSLSYVKADSKSRSLFTVQDVEESIFVSNKINDLTAFLELRWKLAGQNLNVGIEAKKLSVNYNWSINQTDLPVRPLEDVFVDFAKNPFNYQDKTNLYSILFEDKVFLYESFNFTLGFRGSFISKLHHLLPSPYINLSYNFNPKVILNFTYRKYFQYLYTVKEQRNESIYSPFSAFFISRNSNEISSSHNFTIGLSVNNIIGSNFEVHVYYKDRKNLASSNKSTADYSFESGNIFGIDMLLKKEVGDVTGWIGYTFSRSVKNNKQYKYYAGYDRTNNLKILFNYDLSNSWHFAAFWTYATGLPYTPILGEYVGANNVNDVFIGNNWFSGRTISGRKNSARFSDYHRLDIGITGSFILSNLLIKPYLEVMNVYNNDNPYYFEYSPNTNSGKEQRGSYVIPTIGLIIDF